MGVSAHPYKKKDKNQINTNKIMKQNMTTIPFDLELAKKINNGEYNGTIVTSGRNFRVEFVYYKEDGIYPILGVVHTDHGIISDWFSSNGCGSKNYRLELGVPEYTTFKDGDILSNEGGDCIFILNTHGEYLTSLYASLDIDGNLDMEDGLCAWGNHIEKCKFATESERQKLVDALKASKEPKAKEYLKRFFGIEEKPKYEFKPFDKVLVRKEGNKKWNIKNKKEVVYPRTGVPVFMLKDIGIGFRTVEGATEVANLLVKYNAFKMESKFLIGSYEQFWIINGSVCPAITGEAGYSKEEFDKVNKENKDPELESINSFNDTVKKANEIKDRVLKYVYNIKQERSYNNDLVGIFERYKDIADGDMEVAMNFIKEAYPFNEETESFIRKKFDMPIPDESKEQ
jgi:hypothetical protein